MEIGSNAGYDLLPRGNTHLLSYGEDCTERCNLLKNELNGNTLQAAKMIGCIQFASTIASSLVPSYRRHVRHETSSLKGSELVGRDCDEQQPESVDEISELRDEPQLLFDEL